MLSVYSIFLFPVVMIITICTYRWYIVIVDKDSFVKIMVVDVLPTKGD